MTKQLNSKKFLYFLNYMQVLKKFILNWIIIALQCCVGFWYTLTWISHKYTYVPALLNLLPTLYSIPPLQVVTEYQIMLCSTFPLATYLHMVMYIFWCYSLNSSLPLLPPLCPQVCSLCLGLYSHPANRLISTIFLDSIYVYFFFWLTSLCITGSRTDSNLFLFYGWVIFHYIYVPQLIYPATCWWSSRLLYAVLSHV